MNEKQIEEQLRDILKRNMLILGLTGVSVENIKNTDNFLTDLGVESVGMIGLVSEIETSFDIKVGAGELTNETLGSIGSAVKYIFNKLAEK